MRLGVVTTSYPRWPGDPAGAFVAEHVHWLVERGHTVEVIAAGDPGRGPSGAAAGGVRVHRVGLGGALFYRGGAPEVLDETAARGVVNAAGFTAALIAAVARRSSEWEGVIAHWLVPCGAAAALAARGRPLIAIAHSGDVHLLCRARLATPAVALLERSGAEMVFVSRALRARLAAAVHPAYRARVASSPVSSMGIDVARFRRAADEAGAPRAGFEQVLFLGRLVPVKGVHVAIDAAARWRCGARLVIAGAGPEEERLRARAAALPGARIQFAGEVRGAARDALLAGSDALLAPSVTVRGARTEGMPVVALEAMAARVPIIAARVGGLAEVPEDAAVLVEPGDADGLARAVDQLAANPHARQRQVRAAEAYAEARDWSVVGPVFCVNPH